MAEEVQLCTIVPKRYFSSNSKHPGVSFDRLPSFQEYYSFY